ncbi:unnamed protein product, partial [Didymodactylos carnosus]
RKRQVPSQPGKQSIRYYDAIKAVNDTEILPEIIVQFRLLFSIDCLSLICQNDTLEMVTTQTFIDIRFDEILFMTLFGITTSSGGIGTSSTNNSTTLQIPPTSTV